MNDVAREIERRLRQAFPDAEIELRDESSLHSGHRGAQEHGGGHFRVRIVSSRFEGANRLQRHRMVHDVLKDMFRNDIHALSVDAKTPGELAPLA